MGAGLPCCISAPIPNQKLFKRVKLFSTMSEPGLQGWASYHSYGLNLWHTRKPEFISQEVAGQDPKGTGKNWKKGVSMPLVLLCRGC